MQTKGIVFAVVALISACQMKADCPFLKRANAEVTVDGSWLFRNIVTKNVLHDFIRENFPDSEFFAAGSVSLRLSEILEAFSDVFVEWLHAHLFGKDTTKAIKFAAYGAFGHKVWKELCEVAGLADRVSEDVKKNYDLFGAPYVKTVIAQAIDEFVTNLRSSKKAGS